MDKGLTDRLNQLQSQVFEPPPKLTLSEWADTYRFLSPEASAEPGRWRTDRAQYQKEIMDEVGNPRREQVVVMSSAQIGKSEAILNLLGYFIHYEPSPILMVLPTVEMGQSFSKDRIAPLIRDCPDIANKVSDPKSRDGSNTILVKQFAGGTLNIVGANSPSSLSSRPCRVILMDEVDRFPISAGSEGDPVALAIQRSSNFYNRKIVSTSTPTIKGVSRVEKLYEQSDQREYHVRCKSCKGYFVPKWRHIKWGKTPDGEHDSKSARLECPHCHHQHTDAQRNTAVRRGKWIARHPNRTTAGFHLTAIISPWARLSELVDKWLSGLQSKEQLKTFTNTVLGEPFEMAGDRLDDHDFVSRLEDYTPNTVPQDVVLLTAGVDTQDNRLEVEVLGHGADEQSWNIDYQVIHGDTSTNKVWEQLKDYLTETIFTRTDNVKLKIAATCVDSGGHNSSKVHEFGANNKQHRVYAIKGATGSRPIFPKRASKTKSGKHIVYVVGVDSAKDLAYSWLQINEPGPGYQHFPEGRDSDYFAQLTAEERKTKHKFGNPYHVWQNLPGKRNEAWDCRVYSIAAKYSLGKINWKKLEKNNLKTIVEKTDPAVEKEPENNTLNKDMGAEKPKPRRKKYRPRQQKGFISGIMR